MYTFKNEGFSVQSTEISCTDRCHVGSYVSDWVVNSPERRKPKNPRQQAAQRSLFSKSVGFWLRIEKRFCSINGVMGRRLSWLPGFLFRTPLKRRSSFNLPERGCE